MWQVREGRPELASLCSILDGGGELERDQKKLYHHLLQQAEQDVLQAAQAVCVTCVGAGDARLSDMSFSQVLTLGIP